MSFSWSLIIFLSSSTLCSVCRPSFISSYRLLMIISICCRSVRTSAVSCKLLVWTCCKLRKKTSKLSFPISQNISAVLFFLGLTKRAELLNRKWFLNGTSASFREASTGGTFPSANVMRTKMLLTISLPKIDKMEWTMYRCAGASLAKGDWTTKHTASNVVMPSSPGVVKKLRICSTISSSLLMPLVSPNPGVSMMFKLYGTLQPSWWQIW